MNTSMFLPQVAEADHYDAAGRQVDDINSVAEYVYQVVLGHRDVTPEDEDNDDGQNFTGVAKISYFFEQPAILIVHPRFEQTGNNSFFEYGVSETAPVSYDIIIPPPKA